MLRADPHNVLRCYNQLTGSCGQARPAASAAALELWSRRIRRRTRAGGCCLCGGGLGLLATGCHRVWLPLGVACWQLAPELLGETLAQRSAMPALRPLAGRGFHLRNVGGGT
eukprot:COSAG01_NODE_404_length_17467_cov_69.758650_20_plen_112_part_00